MSGPGSDDWNALISGAGFTWVTFDPSRFDRIGASRDLLVKGYDIWKSSRAIS